MSETRLHHYEAEHLLLFKAANQSGSKGFG